MAYGACLESMLGESPRGFESLILRIKQIQAFEKAWICFMLKFQRGIRIPAYRQAGLALRQTKFDPFLF